MRLTVLSCVVLTAALSVLYGCRTESVRRAALVPGLEPSQRTGQPIGDSAAEISAGTSSLVTLRPPSERSGSNAGVAVPRVQSSGDARLRVTEDLDLGLVWDTGLASGAFKVRDDQPDPDHGNVFGGGVSFHYSVPTAEPNFRLGVAGQLSIYSIPWVEYRTCVAACAGDPFTRVNRSRSRTAVLGLAAIPSYELNEQVTLFSGITLRNHPYVPRESVEVGQESDSKLRAGPFNPIVSVGLEYTLPLGLGPRLQVMVDQPFRNEPVRYGPSLGARITIPFAAAAPE